MRKFFRGLAAAGIAVAMLALASPTKAQPYGPGMGYGPGYGMMGRGWGPGYGMGGWGPGWMMGGGWGPGWMMGYGSRDWGGFDLKLSTDQVKKNFERMLAVQGNPRLKVGDVKEKDADTITADIVTKDKDALVQRFVVNRHSGFYHPEE